MGNAFGLSGLTKIPGAVYAVEQDGFATYDKSYSGIIDNGEFDFMQGDHAEEHPNTVLLSLKITETGDNCEHFRLDLHYEGKDDNSTEAGVAANISLDFTTSQEPIESHVDFVEFIGGKPGATLNGAIFTPVTPQGGGEFVGFPVVNPDESLPLTSRFAGLRSYLMPQETATSNTIEYEYPDADTIETIGQIVDPDIDLPTLPGNRNWLNTGIRIQNIANVYYRTQKTFQLSGPRGWITEVYGT